MTKFLYAAAVLLTMMTSCNKTPQESNQTPQESNQTPSHQKLEMGQIPEFIIEKENATIEIVSGSGNYTIEVVDPEVATAELSQDQKSIVVTTQKIGETELIVTDTQSKETKKIRIASVINPSKYVLSQDKTTLQEWKDKSVVVVDMKNDPILKKVTQISYAFSDCKELTSVVLPKGLISVGSGVFLRCAKLTEIVFPASVSDFGSAVFQDSGVQKVTLLSKIPPKTNVTFVGNSTLMFYVPKESFDLYKVAHLWKDLYGAGRLKAIED